MADISIAQAKIHILYLVDAVPGVSYHALMEAVVNSLYADFFTFSQAYNELVAGNLMDVKSEDTGTGEAVGSTEILHVTAGGHAILDDLRPSLNAPVIEHLSAAALQLKETMMSLLTATASYSFQGSDSILIRLSSSNSGMPFTATLTVSSEAQAQKICRAWRKSDAAAIRLFIDSLNLG
ncbi:MAG: DUF4364 family protein [Saccharofermentans sp.]|jgi:hypothetical protein|nr:DUF4364 family protein [Mageeibacillus sp.]MCI1263830.1 DUF4364 family protein [Saccharofermentans sp.]MCI1275894.1 DUF4364 family protein [Saccharofermentans sp.]MCI2043820.1 DUF4364 family protein [Mageeibacillus sp.]